MVLDIYSWIALPWCFVYSVAAATLARCSKIMIAYLAQITETDISRIPSHLCKNILYFSHMDIVSLVISLSRIILEGGMVGGELISALRARSARNLDIR